MVIVIAVVAGAGLAVVTEGRFDLVDGFVFDASLAFRPARPDHASRPVVVVAIDRASLSSARLANVPRVFHGPYFAETLDGLFRAGVKAVGFDVVFAYASSRFEPIDRAYDEPFLAALANYRDRIVLARTLQTKVADPIQATVFDPQRDAGQEEPRAIAFSELFPAADGVQRWFAPSYMTEDGAPLPTLAARLAELAGGPIRIEPFLLAPGAPVESIPTYSFADVLNCIEKDPERLKAAFAGKVVLIGSNLAEEDRKIAPDRFLRWTSAPRPRAAASDECRLDVLGPSDSDSGTVPGVHVHAAAVENLLTGDAIAVLPISLRVATTSIAAAAGAALALFLAPTIAIAALSLGGAVLFVSGIVVLSAGYSLPIVMPAVAAICAMVCGQIARYFVEERRRRRVERAFGHYLAPAIVDKLAQADNELQLGGEVKQITVMFADLTGFTSASERMTPAALMMLTNSYFAVIADAIETTGGYVDKFVGDAVMALWGAPAAVDDGAARAVECAFLIQRRVAELRARDSTPGGGFTVKIGVSTGVAIVGNVGAPRRFNYTALGSTVNLAARIEKICGQYGCLIMVDGATAALTSDRFLLCEVDMVLPRGTLEHISVYEPLGELAEVTDHQKDYVVRYSTALDLYRQGHASKAAVLWEQFACIFATGNGVTPAGVMAERARTEGAPRASSER